MPEICRPLLSTDPRHCWFGNIVDRRYGFIAYDYDDGRFCPVGSFKVIWVSQNRVSGPMEETFEQLYLISPYDIQKEYILEPIAKEKTAFYKHLGHCYYYNEEGGETPDFSELLKLEPWKRLRTVQKSWLHKFDTVRIIYC
jgi:hypothetical protein